MAYRLIHEGRIRHLRIGDRIRIPRLSLVEYVRDLCYNNSTVTDPPSQEVKQV
ncbi:MAG: helix-turn-helix domain-containing protein [Oscillospiraceae bacterium]|nr:helix-turn-helix domain-containing protein [Oscillospiraceae bacterium]